MKNKKLYRLYKKSLKHLAKFDYPWDYSFMIDYLENALRYRLKFFNELENEKFQKVCDSLKAALTKLDYANDMYSKRYYEISMKEVEIKTPLNGKVSAWAEAKDASVEEYTEFKKKEQEAWDDFFLYFSEHFREWWD